jgi:hypothetical protein
MKSGLIAIGMLILVKENILPKELLVLKIGTQIHLHGTLFSRKIEIYINILFTLKCDKV